MPICKACKKKQDMIMMFHCKHYIYCDTCFSTTRTRFRHCPQCKVKKIHCRYMSNIVKDNNDDVTKLKERIMQLEDKYDKIIDIMELSEQYLWVEEDQITPSNHLIDELE